MVYKKIFTCFVTGSVIVLTFAFFTAIIFILTVGYVPFGPIRHNRNFSKELNQAVINLVDQVITIQYKTHCQETLVKIFTEELIKNYDNYIHNFFREESFYFNKNYMQTLHYIDNNQWSVTVAMHEEGRLI